MPKINHRPAKQLSKTSTGQRASWMEKLKDVGVVIGLVGLLVALAAWIWPDLWRDMYGSMQLSIEVPGRNTLEKEINYARMEGSRRLESSAESAIVRVVIRPSLGSDGSLEGGAGPILLTNVSPIKGAEQDIVFTAAHCRFMGKVSDFDLRSETGEVRISVVSCTLDNRDTFEMGHYEHDEIAFLSSVERPNDRIVTFIKQKEGFSLDPSRDYVVRFDLPLKEIPFMGKGIFEPF